MNYTKPKGTYDVLPSEAHKWNFIESTVREVASVHNIKEVRTPMFEASELFHRAAGETSDVVSKETYDFMDRGNRSMTLRPEGTAGVVRSFIENKLYAAGGLQKMFYIAPMFRYERQQKGRYRQHTQFGVEIFGSASPEIDVELISLATLTVKRLGLDNNVVVKLNSLGSQESRKQYRDVLTNHFSNYQDTLCSDCRTRLEKNPLRILDCKRDAESEAMKSAPQMIDHLIPEDLAFFETVKSGLDALGIKYEYDPNLVRGFDYYTHTIFEVQADIEGFGSQTTLCGGGRYDKLTEELGGPSTPAIGFGMGLERIMLAMEETDAYLGEEPAVDLFFLPMGETAKSETLKLLAGLRENGVVCEADFTGRKLKARFKAAEDAKAKYTVVIGDNELEAGMGKVKEQASGEEKEVELGDLASFVKK